MTSWLDCLSAAERGPWSRLRDPAKAGRRATVLARLAGWLPDLGGGRLELPARGPALPPLARDWLAELDPATARDYLRRAREALEAGGLAGDLTWPDAPGGASRRRERALVGHEVAALLAAFPCDESRSLARWLLLTGARPGEARAARWMDLDLYPGEGRGVWRVRGTKTALARRVLPLDRPHLEALPPRGDPLTGRPAGPRELVWPLTDWAWRRAWRAAAVLSGLETEDLVPYCLRHTFATRSLEQGATYEQVAAWLGHANGDTLRKHYRHAVAPQPGAGSAVARALGL